MKRFHYAKIRFVLVGVVIIGLSSMAAVCPAAEDTWTQKADMPTARCTFSTGVVNERIYAIGGAKGRTDALRSVPLQIVEEYHPATDTWTRKADMPTARNALCVSVVDGRIYAIGGSDGIATPLDTVEEYNPETDTWTRKADMSTARYALSTSAVNGKIYAIGGSMGGNRALSTVEQYDPVTDIWTRKADMPTARIHVSTGVVDGKIYAIGGVTGTSASASRSVEQYDPATDTWTRKANMPSAGCTLSTSVVNGKIYAMGGSSPMPALAPLSIVQEYNPATDTWINKTDMPTARSGLSTSAVNGKIYAIGGLANPTGMALATVEEYDTGLTIPSPDFNGDGKVDIEDLIILIEHWHTDELLCDIAPLPFGDGIVDVLDLELLMSYWGQEVHDPSLLAYWKLDETEGTIAYDSADDFDGTWYGDPFGQLDVPDDQKTPFDGVDDYVRTPFVLNPAVTQFSISVWVNGGEPEQVIISQIDNMDLLSLEQSNGGLVVEFMIPGGRVLQQLLITDFIISDGLWHHVVLAWDGTNRSLYVDGVLIAADIQNRLADCDGGFYIGCGKNKGADSFFAGRISDVKVYNRAITP
jgi:N-acetylneuraminic acid mutarotase